LKKVMEGWERFLKENQEGPEKYKLFCDMDGVLVDFATGVLGYMNQRFKEIAANQKELAKLRPDRKNPEYTEFRAALKAAEELGGWDVEIVAAHINRPEDGGSGHKKVRDLMYRLVENNREVWANLPWMPGGKELWAHIKKYNPEILTAPMGPESELGKEDWCARELGNVPVNITDDKTAWGAGDGKRQGLLIDDREKYRAQFRNGGGEVVEHTPGNAGPSIKQLKAFGFH